MAVLILLGSIVFVCGIVVGWLLRARPRFWKPSHIPESRIYWDTVQLSNHWLIDADKTLSSFPHSEGTSSGIG